MNWRTFLGSSLWSLVILAFGVMIGVGGFTFTYAKGLSYMSDDPAACINCHVMRENYNSWTVSSHRNASCNDCHVPHDALGKYLAKAEHGFAHSWAFTFNDVQVIRIKPRSQAAVQENCIRCHEPMVSEITQAQHDTNDFCTRCHRGVGHGF